MLLYAFASGVLASDLFNRSKRRHRSVVSNILSLKLLLAEELAAAEKATKFPN